MQSFFLKYVYIIFLILGVVVYAIYNLFTHKVESNNIKKNVATIYSIASIFPDNLQLYQYQKKIIENKLSIKEFFDKAQKENKFVIINFWAPWCGSCVQEIPLLNTFNQQNNSKIEMIGVSVDKPENIIAFLKQTPINYHLIDLGYEGIDLSQKLGNSMGGLPYTIVVKNNKIIHKHMGELKMKDLQNFLN